MLKNKKITDVQQWNEKIIEFDPDSSPAAWEFYKQFYSGNIYLNKNYDFQKLVFYNCYDTVGLKRGYFDGIEWLNYVNKPIKNSNRLYILPKGTKTEYLYNIEYIIATERIGGDCDFNFNEKKYSLFLDLIKNDTKVLQDEKNVAVQQLERCRNMHHTLLNFSLIQAIGNMQAFKGSNRFDRQDTFISELDKFYRGISNSVLRCASLNNKSALISFLNEFKDIYEYCATFYAITETEFVDEIIKQGGMPITNVKALVRYMSLAEKYWDKKKDALMKL